jgi:hypothetical protein
VDRLVRAFLAAVFQARALWNESGDGSTAEASIGRLAAQNATIFLGEAPAFQAMPWNSPHRLGIYLRAVVEDADDHPSSAEAYFHFLAVQALNASMALEEGAMSEQEVQANLTEVVEDAVDVLLGRKTGAQR